MPFDPAFHVAGGALDKEGTDIRPLATSCDLGLLPHNGVQKINPSQYDSQEGSMSAGLTDHRPGFIRGISYPL